MSGMTRLVRIDVEALSALDEPERGAGGGDDRHVVIGGEGTAQRGRDEPLVVDDEHRLRGTDRRRRALERASAADACCGAVAAGRTTRNVAPLAGRALHLEPAAEPLDDAAADAEPETGPLPAGFVVKNGSKMRGRTAGEIPHAGVGHLDRDQPAGLLARGDADDVRDARRPRGWPGRRSRGGSRTPARAAPGCPGPAARGARPRSSRARWRISFHVIATEELKHRLEIGGAVVLARACSAHERAEVLQDEAEPLHALDRLLERLADLRRRRALGHERRHRRARGTRGSPRRRRAAC